MATLKYFAIFIVGGMSLFSCIKHEIIPPPRPMVELTGTFSADTNGSQITYIKGLNGFDVVATNYREILSPPQASSITYFSSMESTNLFESFRLSVGREFWNAADGQFPNVNLFRLYFENLKNLLSVPFSDDATQGVSLQWRDANNQLWRSKSDSPFPQSFVFLSVSQESDETGDYVKFVSVFTATLYSLDGTQTVTLNNGTFTGYFKNN